ncbi:MAG: DUF5668 domain-containing protein [Bacteroidota bacterium]
MRRNRGSNMYLGLILIVLGGLFLARNFGLLDFHIMWRTYWPVILIVLGASWVVKSLTETKSTPEEKK